jgi:rfaE bifunctional protein kinase chain/domain
MPDFKINLFKGISCEKLNEILAGISGTRIGLIGDLCMDVYWKADVTLSELSRETPHYTLPVVEERMSPGGGANVLANIAALKPKNILFTGVIGYDWRGNELTRELESRGLDTSYVLRSRDKVTNTFCKPIRFGISSIAYEDPRLDFLNYEPLSHDKERDLADRLSDISKKVDVLCVCDQLRYGAITPSIREKVIELGRQGLKVIVDSRDNIGLFTDVTIKPNEIEAYRAVHSSGDPRNAPIEVLAVAARALSMSNNADVCMTIGPRGCLLADNEGITHVPSYEVPPPIDICGAGDTFLSAFACATAAGVRSYEAGSFANMAADVTIAKLCTTGTASPDEIRKRCGSIQAIKENEQAVGIAKARIQATSVNT